MMKMIHSKTQLLNEVAGRCPTKACKRCLDESGAVVLGVFHPPHDHPFILTSIASELTGQKWYVGVSANSVRQRWETVWYESEEAVPWEHWAGDVFLPDLCDERAHCERKRREAQNADTTSD